MEQPVYMKWNGAHPQNIITNALTSTITHTDVVLNHDVGFMSLIICMMPLKYKLMEFILTMVTHVMVRDCPTKKANQIYLYVFFLGGEFVHYSTTGESFIFNN